MPVDPEMNDLSEAFLSIFSTWRLARSAFLGGGEDRLLDSVME